MQSHQAAQFVWLVGPLSEDIEGTLWVGGLILTKYYSPGLKFI